MSTTTLPSRPPASPWHSARMRVLAHWPEYLIEAWALGSFMLSAALFSTLLEHPDSPVRWAVADADLRRVLAGLAMGLTAIALIYSPWGQRSGAHMNPAVTLSFLRLGRIQRGDALAYLVAQFAGGTLGVLCALALLGEAFAAPPVRYAVTQPGPGGAIVALLSEFTISALMMLTILRVSGSARGARWTGLIAGVLVAAFIAIEAPLSGMSMNPARSFASAAPGGIWAHYWLYVAGPLLGMQAAVTLHRRLPGGRPDGCAKLIHGSAQRCIHCGYEPPSTERG